jgi:hypothetical protein
MWQSLQNARMPQIRRRIEQRGDLGFGQLLSSRHSCLPGIPEAGRPADPGEEVDQGGALEAEGAADSRLAGAAVSGAPSDRPGKTVTDSLPLRNAPDTARNAA